MTNVFALEYLVTKYDMCTKLKYTNKFPINAHFMFLIKSKVSNNSI